MLRKKELNMRYAKYQTLTVWFVSFVLLGIASANFTSGDEWVKKDNMLDARCVMASGLIDGKIYLIGGGNNKVLPIVSEYDPKNDTWTEKAEMPTPRAYACANVVNGKIYVTGGFSNDGFGGGLATTEEYNPKTDKWAKKADMPTPRWIFSTAVLDGKIYAFGGFNREYLADVEEYDPIKDEWTKKKDMSASRAASSSCSMDGKIYVIGGGIGGMDAKDVDVYDPGTDKWEKRARMSMARFGLSTSVINGKIYAIGGGVSIVINNTFTSRSVNTVEEYDPEKDRWTEKTEMPTSRFYFAQEVVDGKIYTFGGLSEPSIPLSAVEEYIPEGWPFSVSPERNLIATWGELKRR